VKVLGERSFAEPAKKVFIGLAADLKVKKIPQDWFHFLLIIF
jgi:hypothetical protein